MSSITKDHLRTITVSGRGIVKAVPDTVSIRINVEARRASGKEAQKVVADDLRRLIAILRNGGTEDRYISTVSQVLKNIPEYDDRRNIVGTLGVEATTVIAATLPNTSILSTLLTEFSEVPSYALAQVNHGFSDSETFKSQARKLAIRRAKTRAEEIAAGAEARVTSLHTATEGSRSISTDYLYSHSRGEDESTSVPIMPGEQEISVTIEAIFEIAPVDKGEGA